MRAVDRYTGGVLRAMWQQLMERLGEPLVLRERPAVG